MGELFSIVNMLQQATKYPKPPHTRRLTPKYPKWYRHEQLNGQLAFAFGSRGGPGGPMTGSESGIADLLALRISELEGKQPEQQGRLSETKTAVKRPEHPCRLH